MDQAERPIRIGLIGGGQMGLGLAGQLPHVPGLILTGICDHHQEKVDQLMAVYQAERTRVSDGNARAWPLRGSVDFRSIVDWDAVDVVVEATGTTETAAQVALACLAARKHLVLLNVEVDITIGPLLHKRFEAAGLIYTGSNGDEPAETLKLFRMAQTMGLQPLVAGKGKNNRIDYGANPDTCRAEANARGMNPKMLASFKDGTKTMAEMTLLSNATGFIPDVPGMHGITGDLSETLAKLQKRAEGGILSDYGRVDYVNGLAPGVFVIAQAPNRWVAEELRYMMQQKGDHFIFYRPFHLGSLETPLTIARAFLHKEMAITPLPGGPVCDTVCVAKKDLPAGCLLDGMGGYCLRGRIETRPMVQKEGHVPLGLIAGDCRTKRAVREGGVLTWADLALDESTTIVQLRREQESEPC